MRKFLFAILVAMAPAYLAAQDPIEAVLASVAQNNKSLKAESAYWEAMKWDYKTGLNPDNPKVDCDYMLGSPATAGNQIDMALTQSFDFPTTYAKKKDLSEEQVKHATLQSAQKRQEVLLDAKLSCLELIHQYQLLALLEDRRKSTEKWLADFQTKLEKGDGNILDVNKAKLQLIGIHAANRECQARIVEMSQHLQALNGGIPLKFQHSQYPALISLPDLQALESEILQQDPAGQALQQEKVVGEKKVELQKSMSLSKLEAGYHYQAILGQSFNGVHVGVTLPLWENKNKVEARIQESRFMETNLERHEMERTTEAKQLHAKYISLSAVLEEYRAVLATLNHADLLDKSLRFGQISTIEYFLEMDYFIEAQMDAMQVELECQKTMAMLMRHTL